MKSLKSMASLLLAGAMAMSMAACGGNPGGSAQQPGGSSAGSSTQPAEEKIKIGIIQYVEHPALDGARKGFIDGLAEAGYVDGETISIDFQNGQNDQSNCNTIAGKFVSDNVDLILAIATPAAQAVATATIENQIPVLVTAVTDPAESKLVKDNKAPGGNITGTSDLTPVDMQFELLKKLVPGAQKVGILYASNESNSKIQAEMAKAKAAELGLEAKDFTVSSSNEIQQVCESMINKVDVVYAPTDNTIANGMATVSMVTEPAGIPVICGESGMVTSGGTATIGLDYYELGKQTAAMAVKILKGEAKPAEMPIEYIDSSTLKLAFNDESCKKMNLAIPQELLDQAAADAKGQ